MFFENITTLEELRAEYKRLVFIHHPDKGGSHETMVTINNDYKKLSQQLSKDAKEEQQTINAEFDEAYMTIINNLLVLENLVIEVCGSWIWISGNTKAYKDELKKLGCLFSGNKKMWYWRPEGKKKRSIGLDMGTIRMKYGSVKIQKDEEKKRKKITG